MAAYFCRAVQGGVVGKGLNNHVVVCITATLEKKNSERTLQIKHL